MYESSFGCHCSISCTYLQRKTSEALTKLLSLQAVNACLLTDGRLVISCELKSN